MKNHSFVYVANFAFSSNTLLQLTLFLILFISGWMIENIVSNSFRNGKWVHALFNFKFFLSGVAPQAVLGLFFIHIIHWTQGHHFGLIFLLPREYHWWVAFLIGFLALDFGAYLYHIIMHKIPFLWNFHAVHHSDEKVDVSTVFREHPGESVIRNSFDFLWVFLSGISYSIFFSHLLVQTFFVLFTHAQIRLPKTVNAIVGFIFVTPNIHQVHHHYKQPFTDRNYGDILSIWDRLFKTFARIPQNDLKFGLDCLPERGFLKLLKHPFQTKKSE